VKEPLLPEHSSAETVAEWIAHITGAAPWLGGPISSIISSQISKRREARVKQFVEDLAADLGELRTEVSKEYVRT